MKKIAILVDSSSGLTKKQAAQHNWHFLPLLVSLDGVEYKDGIELTGTNLFNHFSLNSNNVKTSSTPLGLVHQELEKLSKEYDEIIFFPISKHLSSQYQMLLTLMDEFPKLKVVQSLYVAILIPLMVKYLEQLIKDGMDSDSAIKQVEQWNNDFKVTLLPKYNDYLVKGGRLHPTAATIAKLLKIVPLIAFDNGQLIKEGKGRIFLKSVYNSIDDKVMDDDSEFIILHSNNNDINEIVDYIQTKHNKKVYVALLPNVIAIHTGPEAIVVIKTKKLTEEQKALF
ncbi:DegV family EDD domain-containing protein [Mycoplasma sp. NEAQ87857]|uniref:DegV family protein n=1 Tax=Mycoplasma sp. NEAQ87857 TaxID=2683967 RepID=UPI001318BA7F|nr:DegV family protein [Mycoplasma sp. NEAQ87857]QGZ97957.1 DegV family EDD domain-containing protein [Mycoplasma sp. NEAQ87857]